MSVKSNHLGSLRQREPFHVWIYMANTFDFQNSLVICDAKELNAGDPFPVACPDIWFNNPIVVFMLWITHI